MKHGAPDTARAWKPAAPDTAGKGIHGGDSVGAVGATAKATLASDQGRQRERGGKKLVAVARSKLEVDWTRLEARGGGGEGGAAAGRDVWLAELAQGGGGGSDVWIPEFAYLLLQSIPLAPQRQGTLRNNTS